MKMNYLLSCRDRVAEEGDARKIRGETFTGEDGNKMVGYYYVPQGQSQAFKAPASAGAFYSFRHSSKPRSLLKQ